MECEMQKESDTFCRGVFVPKPARRSLTWQILDLTMSNKFLKAASPALRTVALTGSVFLLAGAAASASAATLTVGAGQPYATPCKAFAAAKDGDVIEINAATYSGDVCGIYRHNLVIRGVNGRPKIDAAGKNAMGKGTWVVIGNNISIDNVEMYGSKVADRNGAALRLEGTGFTLQRSFLHDNENGILSGANANSDIRIETTEFGRNGYGDGRSHNLYIGNVRSLYFRYNFSHDAHVGHNLKSRARTNTILYNRFSSTRVGETGTTGAGKPSYEIDLPNAGTSYIVGNVLMQPASNNNAAMIAYGAEGASNPGHDLYVVNNTFLNEDTVRGTFVMVGSTVTKPALFQNNLMSGIGTDVNQASAVKKSNFRSIAPGFVNRATYDLRPTDALVKGYATAAGSAPTGFSLSALASYKHVAWGQTRTALGAADIGAYEAAAE